MQPIRSNRQTEPSAPFVLLGVFAILGAVLFRPGVVSHDGSAYYAWLRSSVVDRDLDFANDIVPQDWQKLSPTGRIGNQHAIGLPIWWSPFFMLAHGLCVGGIVPPPYCSDGTGWLYVTAVSFGTAVLAFIGVLLMLAQTIRFVPAPTALLATLAIWLASPLVVYMLLVPSMAHAASFGVSAVFLAFWWFAAVQGTMRRWFAWGLVGGFLVALRWQSAVWLVLPGVALATNRFTIGRRVLLATVFGAGALLAFSPQMAGWYVLYGTPLTVPQGDGFLHWASPAIVEVLVSARHGLFTWMPLAVPALAGLMLLARRERALTLALAAIFMIFVYVNSVVSDWWAGGAFGPRRFTDTLPIMALGLAMLLDWGNRHKLGTLQALILVGVTAWHWLYVALFFSQSVGPEEALAWDQAVRLAPQLSLMQWVILPTVPGPWKMGPFGTPLTTVAFLPVFLGCGFVIHLLLKKLAALRPRTRFVRAVLCCAALVFLAIDTYILNLG